MRPIDLTDSEWQSLNRLYSRGETDIPSTHRVKLMHVGFAAQKAGRLVVTFEGRLQLREYNNNSQALRQ